MNTWLRRVPTVAIVSLATLATSLIIGTTPPAAADVTPQKYQCHNGYVYLYEDTNGRGLLVEILASWFYDCARVSVTDNRVSSINNRTQYAIELWDLSASPDYLVGTAAPYKAYGYFDAGGNDALDTMASPPCV